MKISPQGKTIALAVALSGLLLIAAYNAGNTMLSGEETLSRIQTDDGWTESSRYLETPSGGTRVYKLCDATGSLVFIAESQRNGAVGVAAVPGGCSRVIPHPEVDAFE